MFIFDVLIHLLGFMGTGLGFRVSVTKLSRKL